MKQLGISMDRRRDDCCWRFKSRSWLYVSFLLTLFLIAGCHTAQQQGPSPAGDGSFPRVVNMADGSNVSIAHKPSRIVSLTLGNDEILCALVDEKRIVGLSKYSQDNANSHVADEARRINSFVDRNAEQIVSLQPDLVLAARYTKIDLKGILAQAKLPTLVTTDFRNFSEIEANITLVGQAVGEEAKAATLVNEMRQKLATARFHLRPENAGLRILYLAPGNFTAGADTSINQLLTATGLKNAAADSGVKGNVKTAAEQILQINPDVILIATGYERDRGFRQLLESDAQLATLKAIKEKRIIELPARNVLTVSQHMADAVQVLVEAVNQLPPTGGKRK
jgi:iron complex transport system substrate-binding protein